MPAEAKLSDQWPYTRDFVSDYVACDCIRCGEQFKGHPKRMTCAFCLADIQKNNPNFIADFGPYKP